MESFLDRLLAAPAPVPQPPRERETHPASSARGLATTTPAVAAQPATFALASPRGSAAPRLAIYDTLTSPPRVVPVEEDEVPALISSLAEKTYHACREQGGHVPFTVIRELMENLIHAFFRDVVVTILDGGQVIRISDHGPGVDDKERAFLPGFTTATPEQKAIIKGVGSGLPVAREALGFLHGVVTVEDNLGGGAVFTISLPTPATVPPGDTVPPPTVDLTTRQKKVLLLLLELGSAGPSAIAKELKIAPATAFRDLGLLENKGLIHSGGDGKRALTEEGLTLLDSVF